MSHERTATKTMSMEQGCKTQRMESCVGVEWSVGTAQWDWKMECDVV